MSAGEALSLFALAWALGLGLLAGRWMRGRRWYLGAGIGLAGAVAAWWGAVEAVPRWSLAHAGPAETGLGAVGGWFGALFAGLLLGHVLGSALAVSWVLGLGLGLGRGLGLGMFSGAGKT